MSGPNIKRGDILLVTFPFSDLTSRQVRPALVLSNDRHNTTDPDLVCLMITSQARKARSGDFVLHKADPDFGQAGLRYDSVFRVSRLASLDATLAQKRLGTASDRILNKVGRKLGELLELPASS